MPRRRCSGRTTATFSSGSTIATIRSRRTRPPNRPGFTVKACIVKVSSGSLDARRSPAALARASSAWIASRSSARSVRSSRAPGSIVVVSLRSAPASLGPGTPTNRSPSSSYWAGSGGDGASSIRSAPDCVFGKAMTSRMFDWWASSAAQRSIPRAIPPCGGGPYSNASRSAPNFSFIPSSVWPWRAKLRASRSRRWIRIEPPPSSQPFRTMSYWSARARPAGSPGIGLATGRRTRS